MKAPLTILLTLGSLLHTATSHAQASLYQDISATSLPPGLAGACMDASAADADGDGDLDLALAMEFQTNVLLLNDGAGNFTDRSAQIPRTAHDSEDVAFADFDNDGDLDLVFVSEDDRSDELWLNAGAGLFTDFNDRINTDDVSNALVVMDLDGDGIPDVLTGNIGIDRVLISDGSGGFRDATRQRWPQDGNSRTQDLEAADVDGDGDLDVLVGNEGQNQLFRNDAGRLVDVTAVSLPVRNDETREIRAVDVDGDGDLDLLVANVQFLLQESAQDYLLLNDGNGVFSTAEASRYPEDARSNFTVQAVDLDHDGDMDVLAPSTVFARTEAVYVVTVADAAGVLRNVKASNLEIRDADNDGDLDAVSDDEGQRRAFINDGDKLVMAVDDDIEAAAGNAQTVDIDNDGRAELTVTTFALPQTQSGTTGGRSRSTQMQLLDLGGNGATDIIVTVNMSMDTVGDYLVLLNDGSGNFTRAAPGTVLPPNADGNGFDIEVADFDGDGITDLFFCNRASISEAGAAVTSGGLQRLLRGVR